MLSPKSRWFTVLLGAMTAMTALSIDMSLPTLPTLALWGGGGDAGRAQLTLSLFLWGYAGSQLVCGPLSDRHGRRPVLLAGLVLFTLAGAGCAAAPTLPCLIGMRFLQGLGAGVGPVLSRAIVRDSFDREAATGVFSQITQVMIVAPMVAPTLGGFLLTAVGWRAIFVFLALAGLALWLVCRRALTATARADGAAPFSLKALQAQYGLFLSHRTSVGYMLVVCFASGGMFAYITGSPFVLIDVFGVRPHLFGLFFALTASALLLGATANRALVTRLPSETLLRAGIGCIALGAAGLLASSELRAGGLAGVIVPMMFYLFGLGVVVPHATAAAMEPFPQMAGTVSSLIGGFQTILGGVSGYCVGAFYRHSSQSMAVTVAAMGVALLLAFVCLVHAHETVRARERAALR